MKRMHSKCWPVFRLTFCNFTVPQERALTHVVSCCYLIVGYSAEISFSVCGRVTQIPGKYPTGIRCRHYRTCLLGHSPRCRPGCGYTELWSTSSAKETAAGFLPSTSPTDAQNINTGSWHDFSSSSISWALVAALWCLVARTTTTLMSMRKDQRTVSFTFPTTAVRQKELSWPPTGNTQSDYTATTDYALFICYVIRWKWVWDGQVP